MRMLIFEHDWALGAFLARVMEEDGNEVMLAGDGERALDAVRTNPPEMAIVDVDGPEGDGLEVLRGIRACSGEMPIVVLASGHDAAMRWLEGGADDVVEKPLSLLELRARCRGLLRRRVPGLLLRHGALEVNRAERSVTRHGETIPLTNREYALLEFLLERRGQAVSRRTLLERVWNRSAGVQTNVVDVYVNYLRRKLHDGADTDTPLIQTVRGQGYSIAGLRGQQ